MGNFWVKHHGGSDIESSIFVIPPTGNKELLTISVVLVKQCLFSFKKKKFTRSNLKLFPRTGSVSGMSRN